MSNFFSIELLTHEELDFVSNGCGPKGGFTVPSFASDKSCNQHDLDYWVGGDEAARKEADSRFYKNLVIDSERIGGFWGKIYRAAVANTFYWAVRFFGAGSFHYGEPRTLKDLQATVKGLKNAKV